MPKKKPKTKEPTPDFEQAMGQLESIVRRLEHGGGTLEEALTDYSQAIALMKVCHTQLDAAQRRVEVLTGLDADGNPITQPVEDADLSLEERRAARSQRRTASGSAKSKAAGTKRNQADTELF